jgi:aminopeptidase N
VTYGDVELSGSELDYLTSSLHAIEDPLERGSALVMLWENMLEGRVEPRRVLDTLLTSLEVESNELTVTRMLGYLGEAFWRFTPAADRPAVAPRVEAVLKSGLDRASSTSLKTGFFNALRSVATTRETLDWLRRVWAREEKVPGVPLSEADESELALELAVRGVSPAEVVNAQLARIQNPDRFESLKDVDNRRREAWVLEAARYLHHPVRQESSRALVVPALELVHEIQRTGDIFFPKRWTDATLGGYQSEVAAAEVRRFIDGLPGDYPPRLRWVLLASADPLFRAARLR